MKTTVFWILLLTSSAIQAQQVTYTEEQKINHLILFIAQLQGATFIRNGDEHTPQKAAEHLKMKLEKAGSRIKTANNFIEKLASKSSVSGEAYMIRFANGKTFPSQLVLLSELKKLEEGKVKLNVE
jgi:hypothetical protein